VPEAPRRYEALLELRQLSSGLAFGPGLVDGVAFEELSTLDDRLPGCLEVGFDGAYHWLWLGAVRTMEFAVRPGNLTDLRWVPAKVVMDDGSQLEMTVFGCFPGTEGCAYEDAIIGRVLHWLDAPDELAVGAGPQVLAFDGVARAIHGIRQIGFGDIAADPSGPGIERRSEGT
jgi:protein involved in temperature-dependent protein secretion